MLAARLVAAGAFLAVAGAFLAAVVEDFLAAGAAFLAAGDDDFVAAGASGGVASDVADAFLAARLLGRRASSAGAVLRLPPSWR